MTRSGTGAGLALVAVAVLLAGCGTPAPRTSVAAVSPAPGWSAVPGQVAQVASAPPVTAHAEPVEVRIASIGVRSALDRLVLDPTGVLTPPADPARAGWFAGGVRPGDPGPAVIAGHVDSRTGAAVFTRLAALRPGAVVEVTDAKGAVARFSVEEVKTYSKAGFPTAQVYGATPDPELRLITCGGAFDQGRGHYVDNVVVYATLMAPG